MALKIIIHDYGGYAFPLDLSRELGRRGFSVSHLYVNLVPEPRADFSAASDNVSIEEVRISKNYARDKYNFFRRFLYNFGYGFRLAKRIVQERADFVVSGNAPTEIQIFVLLASRISGSRFVNWMQDAYSIAVLKILENKFLMFGRWFGLFYLWFDRLIALNAYRNLVIMGGFSELLASWGVRDERICLFPNWTPLSQINVLPRDNSWAHEHKLEANWVLLYSGTLGLKHNPDILLALAERLRADERFLLIVVSEGKVFERLKTAALERDLLNIRFLPFQPEFRLSEVLASADSLCVLLEDDASVFSLPSKSLSYLCSARPIIAVAPKDSSLADLLEEAQAGEVVQVGDEDALVKCVERLKGDARFSAELGGGGRKYAEEHFAIKGIVTRFEKFLNLHE